MGSATAIIGTEVLQYTNALAVEAVILEQVVETGLLFNEDYNMAVDLSGEAVKLSST